MEQLKIKKRESVVNNSIFHLVLSFFFLYVEYAYRHHLSPFSYLILQKSFLNFWPQLVFFFLSSLLIWRMSKSSLTFFFLSTLLVSYKISESLYIEFNKLIVIGFFCYLVVSFFVYQILKDYLNKAYLNPNFKSTDMFPPLLKEIPVKVKKSGEEYQGFLTNWDEDGCFIKLSSSLAGLNHVEVEINFYGRDFTQTGEVVAQSVEMNAIGIKFNKSKKDLNVFNWSEFIELTEELGFQAERLR